MPEGSISRRSQSVQWVTLFGNPAARLPGNPPARAHACGTRWNMKIRGLLPILVRAVAAALSRATAGHFEPPCTCDGRPSRSKSKPFARCVTRRRMGALAAPTRARGDAARRRVVRGRWNAEPCVLSDHRHRVASVRDGKRRLCRDRRGRQRRHRRHFAVHGWRVDAEPCGGAERRPWLSARVAGHQGGIQPCAGAAPAAALHAGADHADVANGRVQPAPFARSTTLPLASVEPGPPLGRRAGDDAGADRQHARGAPRGRDRERTQAAEGRTDPLHAGSHHDHRSPRAREPMLRVLFRRQE